MNHNKYHKQSMFILYFHSLKYTFNGLQSTDRLQTNLVNTHKTQW